MLPTFHTAQFLSSPLSHGARRGGASPAQQWLGGPVGPCNGRRMPRWADGGRAHAVDWCWEGAYAHAHTLRVPDAHLPAWPCQRRHASRKPRPRDGPSFSPTGKAEECSGTRRTESALCSDGSLQPKTQTARVVRRNQGSNPSLVICFLLLAGTCRGHAAMWSGFFRQVRDSSPPPQLRVRRRPPERLPTRNHTRRGWQVGSPCLPSPPPAPARWGQALAKDVGRWAFRPSGAARACARTAPVSGLQPGPPARPQLLYSQAVIFCALR